jgi:hypothetical protein
MILVPAGWSCPGNCPRTCPSSLLRPCLQGLPRRRQSTSGAASGRPTNLVKIQTSKPRLTAPAPRRPGSRAPRIGHRAGPDLVGDTGVRRRGRRLARRAPAAGAMKCGRAKGGSTPSPCRSAHRWHLRNPQGSADQQRSGAGGDCRSRGPAGSLTMTGSSMPSASHARQMTAISRTPLGPGLCRITVTIRRSASSACSADHAVATSSAAVVISTTVLLPPV